MSADTGSQGHLNFGGPQVRNFVALTILATLLSVCGCALPPADVCAVPQGKFTGCWDGWSNAVGKQYWPQIKDYP
ncbi:MAG TPA: hypothetical protein VGJ16_01150 [Pirellulales bacterium]|jgi:hypothetical protein